MVNSASGDNIVLLLSVVEILWCDHSNNTSSAALLFFNILQNKVWNFSRLEIHPIYSFLLQS